MNLDLILIKTEAMDGVVCDSYFTEMNKFGIWVDTFWNGLDGWYEVNISTASRIKPEIGDYLLYQGGILFGNVDDAKMEIMRGITEIRDNLNIILNIILDKYMSETDKGNQEKGVRK